MHRVEAVYRKHQAFPVAAGRHPAARVAASLYPAQPRKVAPSAYRPAPGSHPGREEASLLRRASPCHHEGATARRVRYLRTNIARAPCPYQRFGSKAGHGHTAPHRSRTGNATEIAPSAPFARRLLAGDTVLCRCHCPPWCVPCRLAQATVIASPAAHSARGARQSRALRLPGSRTTFQGSNPD